MLLCSSIREVWLCCNIFNICLAKCGAYGRIVLEFPLCGDYQSI